MLMLLTYLPGEPPAVERVDGGDGDGGVGALDVHVARRGGRVHVDVLHAAVPANVQMMK